MKIEGIYITCQAKVDDKIYETGCFSPADQPFSINPEDPMFQFTVERLVEDIKKQSNRYPDKIGILISVRLNGRYPTSDWLNKPQEPAIQDSETAEPEPMCSDSQG